MNDVAKTLQIFTCACFKRRPTVAIPSKATIATFSWFFHHCQDNSRCLGARLDAFAFEDRQEHQRHVDARRAEPVRLVGPQSLQHRQQGLHQLRIITVHWISQNMWQTTHEAVLDEWDCNLVGASEHFPQENHCHGAHWCTVWKEERVLCVQGENAQQNKLDPHSTEINHGMP